MTSHPLLRSAAAVGLLVLALTACGGDDPAPAGGASNSSTTPPAAVATTDKIEVKSFAFKPKDTTVKAGTTVTWTFNDDVDHNVDPVGASELAKKSDDLKSGKTFAFTFTKPGTLTYRCSIHNSMTGSVVVTA